MQVTLSRSAIQKSTCCAQLMQWLALAMSEPSQLWKLFPVVVSGEAMLECFLTKGVDFCMYSSHVNWHGVEVPYSIMEPYTLYLIKAIIIMQRRRRSIFHETVTNLYTIRYEKCVYNTLLEHHIDYTQCAHIMARYYAAESRALRKVLYTTLENSEDQRTKDKCNAIIDPSSSPQRQSSDDLALHNQ